MNQFLSSQQREALKAQHRRERDKRVCDRIKAVLLTDHGWDIKDIALALLLSEDAVEQHVREYLDLDKLKPENGGSTGKLNDAQSKDLLEHLQSHVYLYTKHIVAYVETQFGIKYSVFFLLIVQILIRLRDCGNSCMNTCFTTCTTRSSVGLEKRS